MQGHVSVTSLEELILPEGILELQATAAEAEAETPPRVRWTDDTIDNEHLGRKKSNGIG